MSIHVGDLAPEFKLSNQFGEEVSLAGLRGKPVVVVFYPLSFSGICTGELCELRDNIAMFETSGVELLAISVDSKFVQAKFAEQEGYTFSVLADFWPHGGVASDYGVFLETKASLLEQPSLSTHLASSPRRWSMDRVKPEVSQSTKKPSSWSCSKFPTRIFDGPLAQLVERHAYTVDVIGSSPVGPTRPL